MRAAGAIAAMAMTGMRTLTGNLGLVERPPPHAIIRQRAASLLRRVPRRRRRSAIELAHWGYGAVGGIEFALFRSPCAGSPGRVRSTGWPCGWASKPGSRRHSDSSRPASGGPIERVALAADHLLYGLVLSEIRRRPQA